jgi:hypothetical protein
MTADNGDSPDVERSPDSEEPDAGGRNLRVLFVKLGLASGVALLELITLLTRDMPVVTRPGAARTGAVVMIVAGVTVAGRLGVHLRDNYWQWPAPDNPKWTTRQQRSLSALVVLDGVIAAALVAWGIWIFFEPNAWFQMGLSLFFAAVFFVASMATMDLIEAGGLPRGTETIQNCGAVVWLRKAAKRSSSLKFVRRLDQWIWTPTQKDRLSGLAIAVVLALASVGVIDAVAVSPQVREYLSSKHDAPNEGTDKSGKGTQENRRQAHSKRHKPERDGKGRQDTKPTPPPRRPTYVELCGNLVPGTGAPKAEARALKAVWAEFGGAIAGCAERAKLVPGTRDVYYVPGNCNGEFRSMAVVSPGYPAAMLLDQPAEFAREMAQARALRGASQRLTIAGGDFQVVYTTMGGFVLIRENPTDGRGGLNTAPRSCLEVTPAKREYVVVPPPLADLWLKFGRLMQPTWPARDVSRDERGRTFFSFYGQAREVVAAGFCTGPTHCVFKSGGVRWDSASAADEAVTAARVTQYGPR